ncbi:hypothetical protein DD788_30345, partial [Ralstonia pickettii]|nr:hypothetical protein [Ralstonia pickettii]
MTASVIPAHVMHDLRLHEVAFEMAVNVRVDSSRMRATIKPSGATLPFHSHRRNANKTTRNCAAASAGRA